MVLIHDTPIVFVKLLRFNSVTPLLSYIFLTIQRCFINAVKKSKSLLHFQSVWAKEGVMSERICGKRDDWQKNWVTALQRNTHKWQKCISWQSAFLSAIKGESRKKLRLEVFKPTKLISHFLPWILPWRKFVALKSIFLPVQWKASFCLLFFHSLWNCVILSFCSSYNFV